MDALKVIPKMEVKLKTEKGIGLCQKIDIFKGLMWYCYDQQWMNWHEIPVHKVNEIIELNKKGTVVESLEAYVEAIAPIKKETFNNVVGQDSLTRFDQPKNTNKRNRSDGNARRKNRKKNAT